MEEAFQIWIDRLKGGRTQKIEEQLNPSFLGPDEPELRFKAKVHVKGEAYLTDAHLIVHLKAHCTVSMPCAVCNKLIEVALKEDNFYHTEPIKEIPSAIFDYREALREALLLELPRTTECNEGNCPERESLQPYLRPESRKEKTTYFPFADLEDKN